MSSVLSNKFEDVNVKTSYLIYGYIKLIEIIIPTSIIELIIKFYYSKSIIIYLEQDDNEYVTPQISISQLHNKHHYKCNIQPLSESNNNGIEQYMNRYNDICYVKDFEIPQHILSNNNDKLYKYNVDDLCCKYYTFVIVYNSIQNHTFLRCNKSTIYGVRANKSMIYRVPSHKSLIYAIKFDRGADSNKYKI